MLDAVRLTLVETDAEAEALLRWIDEPREIMGFDTETEGLDWWRHKVRLFQIGDAHRGWAMDFSRWRELVQEAILRWSGKWTAHNAPFDYRMLEHAGIKMMPREMVDDTAPMAHILDNRRPAGLKPLSSSLVDPRAEVLEKQLDRGMKENGWDWATVPITFRPYWTYGALDPVLATRIYQTLRPQIQAAPKLAADYSMERRLMWVVDDMEARGLPMDEDYAERLKLQLQLRESAASAAITAQWPELANPKTGNPVLSAQRLSKIFLRDGVVLTEKTKTGQWMLDAAVLSGIDHPLAELITEAKRTRKWRVAYVEALIDRSWNGRVRPSVHPNGARSGRMSVSGPPLQQLPSSQAMIRDVIVARPGHKLISIDYDQIELRVLAHLTQEPAMIQAIFDGEDLHMANARMLYGPEATKEHRKLAKGGAFAKVYGAGPAKLAKQQGISVSQATSFMRKFDRTFKGLSGTFKQMQDVARERISETGRGFIWTRFNRRLFIDDGKPYTVLNYYCQGTAAEVLKRAVVALDDAGLSKYLLMLVHDEAIFEVPEDEADAFLAQAEAVMSDTTNFLVPISASGEVVKRWGDAYDECRKGHPERCEREFCNARSSS